ncbi:glycosyltransferase [Gillisia sp. CAL575]|uniref:glycosyltransferase n=1 Tax=Gillisia sp. CAL575 TaxID=985255 RepID=UPI00039EECBF|nr:glycosyltransferase [Gillisia sp. CAL575]
MIRVLFLIDTLLTGGAEKSLVSIASKFTQVEPVFVHIYDGNFLEKSLKGFGIKVFSLGVKRNYNFDDATARLLPILQEVKPDIIHSTLFNSDIVARRIKAKYPVLLINSFVNNSYTAQRYSNSSIINKFKLFLFQQYDKFSASNVDLFISNSEAIKLTNASALNIPHQKIKVIHRGREISQFQPISSHQKESLKRELKLSDETVLLNVGRLLERKGQMDLLVAFKKLVLTQPNLKLLIAGEGSFKNNLKEFIDNNGLASKVMLLGNRNDISDLLQLADYFIFPSWYEGLPGSLIEAMMAGTPIVASDIPENLECISRKTGLIFETKNSDDLKTKIITALNDRDGMLEKSRLAKLVALEKFDINKIASVYEKTYLDLIEKKSLNG